MLRLNEVIEKSKQLTTDNFSLFVDGILRIQECDRCEFNEYMLKYKANNIIDIAESLYYNKVYVYTDIKNLGVDEYVNEVCDMKDKVTIGTLIIKALNVLDLTLITDMTNKNYVKDYNGNDIGYYTILDTLSYFYNKNDELITIVQENSDIYTTLIQVSSALTNLYNLEQGSIS